MTLQFSTLVRNARLDAIETAVNVSPILKIRSGAPPVNAAAADIGTVLATLLLPSDWMGAAASGSKAMSGIWQDLSADATGSPGHFRIYDSGGVVCHIQGTASIAGGGGDIILDSASLTAGQLFNVTSFTVTDGNA